MTMSNVLYKDLCVYHFLRWLDYRDLDDPTADYKFRQFAKLVAKYRAKNWLELDYFSSKILTKRPNQPTHTIEIFHRRLVEYVDFYKLETPRSCQREPGDHYYIQRGVYDNQRYQIVISEQEFQAGGITSLKGWKKRYIDDPIV